MNSNETFEKHTLCAIGTVGTLIVTYLDPATYHNFYLEFKHRMPPVYHNYGSNESHSDQVLDCIKFIKYHSRVNYAQAIVSIYCTDIKNWNKTKEHSEYYNQKLNCKKTAKFQNPILPIKLIDKNIDEQIRIDKKIIQLNESPFNNDVYYIQNNLLPFYSQFLGNKNNIKWLKNRICDSCFYGNLGILKLLLTYTTIENNIFNIDTFVESYQTILILACDHNHTNIIKYLLKIGADPNIRELSNDRTALYYAIINNNFEIVKCLVESKININDGVSLFEACCSIKRINILKYLIKNGCNINQKNKCGRSALFVAIYSDLKESFDILMDNGIDCNILINNQNALMTVCQLSDYYINKKYFCERLALSINDINTKNKYGKTALDYAIETGNREIIALLIDNGAERQAKRYKNAEI